MNNFSRRSFIKSTSMASTGLFFIPNFRSNAPNNRLNIAVIGVGGRGKANWGSVPNENIVAMCDVDDNRAAAGYLLYPKARKFKDFRVMFDKMSKEIDAVIITTPDHTHFAATMIAMELGIDVYVEKPLAHNIWQLRTMKKAAKYYNITSQMGNQGHTTNGIRLIKEWYDAGILGQVNEVHAWHGAFNFGPGKYFTKPESFPPKVDPVPEYLDWDLWLGPAKDREFNSAYAPKSWRGFYDFGNGQLGDWACHTLDAPFWALDLGSPHTVEAIAKNPMSEHGFVADESVTTFQFGARKGKEPVTLKWYEGGEKPEIRSEWGIEEFPRSGMLMIGEKNTLMTGGRPNKPELLISPEEWAEFQANSPEKTIPRIGEEKPVDEWIDAIKNNYLPGSNFDYAAELTEMALVGVLAQRFATKIEYDTENMRVTNRPELNIFVKEPVRKGWSYGENL
ncbi:Gfo/Idh/MocA family oxidoreductase [uncultured Wocania sp.]|uniref:Gfo/Idh/MocA family oxidoreductase n=1 Tax=uncultured Wocania sp. TaxID=2834404 RepID=UPI0030F64FE8